MTHPHLTAMERVARTRRKFVRAWLPIDVPTFVKQVKALPVFKDCPRSIARTKVEIVYTAHSSGGIAHGNRKARVRVSPSTDLAHVLETIVHELVHCALPDGVVHGERFRLTLARTVRELWGIDVDPNPKDDSGRVSRYGLDHIIEGRLRDMIVLGQVTYPMREAPVEEDTATRRRAASEALVTKRAAHAATMLARAEKRSKAAQRALTKWRAKVRYYERQAAKRAT